MSYQIIFIFLFLYFSDDGWGSAVKPGSLECLWLVGRFIWGWVEVSEPQPRWGGGACLSLQSKTCHRCDNSDRPNLHRNCRRYFESEQTIRCKNVDRAVLNRAIPNEPANPSLFARRHFLIATRFGKRIFP